MHARLLVSLDSIMLLRLSAPLSFLLRFNKGSAIAAKIWVFSPELTYPFVKGLTIYLILLKIQYALVQLLPSLSIGNLVKDIRVGNISRMKLKV